MNRYGYAMLGSLIAILSSRLYVVLDGSLNFPFDNHVLHHAYYRFGIMVLTGMAKLIEKVDVDMSGMKWFNEIGQNQVRNPLNEALDLMNRLQDQVENRKRREK